MKPVVKAQKFCVGGQWKMLAAIGLIVFGACMLFFGENALAMRISLKRIVFEGKKRSEILTIINNGAQSETYRLGWRRYRMEGKSLKKIREGDDDSDIRWADDMIRFAPRRVTIPPGSAQQIRLLFRRPANLEEAEYRAHLWIVTEAKPEKFEVQQTVKEGKSIRLSVQPAISLPIFVRNGNLTATSSITDFTLSKNSEEELKATFNITREGDRSIYGDLDFVCKSAGEDVILRQVKGVAVYLELPHRKLSYNLPLASPEQKGCTQVKIIYRSISSDSHFQGAVLAEGSAQL